MLTNNALTTTSTGTKPGGYDDLSALTIVDAAGQVTGDITQSAALRQDGAELALLGLVVQDATAPEGLYRDLLSVVASRIGTRKEDAHAFTTPVRRAIYRAMLLLGQRALRPDLQTLHAELQARQVVGYTHDDLLACVRAAQAASDQVEGLCQAVLEAHARRQIMRIMQQGTMHAAAGTDAETIKQQTATAMERVRQPTVGADTTSQAIAQDYLRDLEGWFAAPFQLRGTTSGLRNVDNVTMGWQPGDLIAVCARMSGGKCLSYDTLVDDPATGDRLTIAEAVRRRLPTIYGVSEEGAVRATAVGAWIDSGVKPVYRVTTRLGRVVEVTGHHPFLTVNGWAPLHDLQVGVKVAVPTALPIFGTDAAWPLERVRLLAYLVAEGGLTQSPPRFTNTDPVLVRDFTACMGAEFPECEVRQLPNDPITYICTTGRTGGLPNPLTTWLRNLGLMGKRAEEKALPPEVWRWPRTHLAELLRVLLSCDGTLYSLQGFPRIEFTVASERLARDVLHALLRFGIIAKLWRKTARSWRVEITAPAMVARYQQEVGWLGEKAERFEGYAHSLPKRGSNNGHAPAETWALIEPMAKAQGLSITRLAYLAGEIERTGHDAGYNPQKKQGITRERLARYADILGSQHLRRVASPDLYWDEIIAIEPQGEKQVYDLTVPDGANFVAADVVVHNTHVAMHMARRAAEAIARAESGHQVGVLSLEMSCKALFHRLVAAAVGVSAKRIKQGDPGLNRLELRIAAQELANLPMRWIDNQGAQNRANGLGGQMTPEAIRRVALAWHREAPLDLLVVDFLERIAVSPKVAREGRERQLAYAVECLKDLATELNIPVMLLAQINRETGKRGGYIPELADIRGTDVLAQLADVVCFPVNWDYWPARGQEVPAEVRDYPKGTTEFVIAKHRNGEVGGVKLWSDPRTYRLYDMTDTLVPVDYKGRPLPGWQAEYWPGSLLSMPQDEAEDGEEVGDPEEKPKRKRRGSSSIVQPPTLFTPTDEPDERQL